jgi:hypothetical protein
VANAVGPSRRILRDDLQMLGRNAVGDAASMSGTRIKMPRSASERAITARRDMPGSRRAIDSRTRARNGPSGLIRMDCASSSCSACEKRSIATQSGLAWPSQITRISLGPAIMSMPTVPNTLRLAWAT